MCFIFLVPLLVFILSGIFGSHVPGYCSLGDKLILVPLYTPQIPHRPSWDRTRGPAVKSRPLSA